MSLTLTTPVTRRTKNSAYRHVEGMGALEAVLQGLPVEVRETILAQAVHKTALPLVKWQKRYARRSMRTGALHDSISYKVKKYGNTTTAVAIVGPSRDYYLTGNLKDGNLAAGGYIRPAHYAHLVEYGHHAVKPIKGTQRRKKTAVAAKTEWVPAKPFVRPAAFSARAEMAAAFDASVTRSIEQKVASLQASAR